MDNLKYFNLLSAPPQEALKTIPGGRLKGKTDINPVWRMKAVTELFGPVGVGWKYTIERQWTEAGDNGQICAFCNINVYYKHEGEWSEGIPGTGGSALIAKEISGLYTNDEAYKMALTDALGVAFKALGVAANVYWKQDPTKYGKEPTPKAEANDLMPVLCAKCDKEITSAKGIAYAKANPSKKVQCWDCAQAGKNNEL